MGEFFTWDALMSAWAYFVGMVGGGASMLLYLRLSNQEKLKSLKLQSANLQQQLSSYEGDFSGALALSKQNLSLNFRRLGCAAGPSLLSALPVIVGFFVIGEFYFPYLLATIVTALAAKYQFQIA